MEPSKRWLRASGFSLSHFRDLLMHLWTSSNSLLAAAHKSSLPDPLQGHRTIGTSVGECKSVPSMPLWSKTRYLGHLRDTFQSRRQRGLESGPFLKIVGPFDEDVTNEQRGDWQIAIMKIVYGEDGHSLLDENPQDVRGEQNNGTYTWFLLQDGRPISTASVFNKGNGVGEFGLSAGVPKGLEHIDADGQAYTVDKTVRLSASQYARSLEAVGSRFAADYHSFETTLRTVKKLTKHDGSPLQSGIPTQVVNQTFTPLLAPSPRYLMSRLIDGEFFRSCYIYCRLHLQPEGVRFYETYYTPKFNTHDRGAVSLVNISATTFAAGYGHAPNFAHQAPAGLPQLLKRFELLKAMPVHHSIAIISGGWSRSEIQKKADEQLEDKGYLELRIPNHPGNLALQDTLYKMGAVPMGIIPGGRYLVNEQWVEETAKLVFAFAKEGVPDRMQKIEFASHIPIQVQKQFRRVHGYWKDPDRPYYRA